MPTAALQNPQTRALLDKMLGEVPALRNAPDGAQRLLDALGSAQPQSTDGANGQNGADGTSGTQQSQQAQQTEKQQRMTQLVAEILALQGLRDQMLMTGNQPAADEATKELSQKIQELAQLTGAHTDENGNIPAQYGSGGQAGQVQPGTGMYNTAPSYSGSQGPTSVPPGFVNNPDKQQTEKMLDEAANKYGIPPEILKGIAYKESRWNNGAVGDQGRSTSMMQINKQAHPDYDVQRGRQDPSYAIDYAAKLLRGLYDQYHDWGKAVEHYNGSGPMAQAYSADVMNNIAPKFRNA
jgi:soluble lytic murein transglycosylase-like protein